MSTAATFASPRRRCTSRIAAISSPTASMRSARFATAAWSTSGGISIGSTVRSASSGSRCRCARSALGVVLRETVRRNRVRDGLIYLQVTRGVARRDHGFPPPGTRPSLVVTARPLDRAKQSALAETGIAVRHRARQPLVAGRHQERLAAAERAGAGRRRAMRARARPGSSMQTGSSRRAPPPMPGSSPDPAGS